MDAIVYKLTGEAIDQEKLCASALFPMDQLPLPKCFSFWELGS